MSKILIVDDDIELIETLSERFKKEGWQVNSITGAYYAYQKIEDNTFDLVISDIRMPHGTGLELLRKIRKSEIERVKNIPVIIMTGLLDGGEAYLKSLGARGVFLKSNPLDLLIKMIKQLITVNDS